jgi:hypothetical protein
VMSAFLPRPAGQAAGYRPPRRPGIAPQKTRVMPMKPTRKISR